VIKALAATLAPFAEAEKPQLSPRVGVDFIKNICRISHLYVVQVEIGVAGMASLCRQLRFTYVYFLQGFCDNRARAREQAAFVQPTLAVHSKIVTTLLNLPAALTRYV